MVTIRKVAVYELVTLLPLIKTTFFVAFGHQNNPEDFKAYTDKAFAPEQVLFEPSKPSFRILFCFIR